ncbi:filamentous hemagglutinin family outer membrane protein [Burkholderia glumae BGR1]|nr:filamentous hemagglutinin family outer membrane protein [Burkholderia glumae BGR1]
MGAVGRTNVANATAPAVLSHIALPAGGLFSVVTAPQTPYLIETNPAFTSAQQWLSSDYYFQQTGMDPSKIQLRLGDGFYEQKLVQDQIMAMTGKAVLTNYADTQAEYQALMTSGAALAKALDLAPGTGLSPEQVAQLTSNVVIMQTQVVDGKSVLVPVVYLAQASQQDMRNGPLIAATNIDLQNAVAVNNSGTISASNDFSISSQRIDSSFGTLQSGGNMSLVSSGDVNLTSATVNAGSLQLKAGGNLVLDSAVNTLNQSGNGGATRTTTSLGPLASINVSGNASIVTGGNFEQNAGSLNVGGALGLNVGGDWTLGVQQTGESQLVYRHGGVSDTRFSIDTGSSVKVGGAAAIVVGGNLSATGANLNLGGGGAIEVGGNLNLQAAVATSTIDSSSSGSESHRSYAEARHVSDDAVIATTLTGGDSLTLAAGKDINVLGSTVSLDRGAAQLVAGGNVTIGAVTETHVNDSHETHSHSGLASSTKVASSRDTTTTLADGSTISADSVSIVGGQDLNVRGSTIVGTHDVSLTAAHDVNITTTQDTMDSSGSYQEKHSGLMAGGGLSVSVGTSKLATTDQDASVTNNASTIGSLSGNLTIRAGDTLHVTGSDLIAAKNLTGIASTVTIDAATDTSHQSQTQQTSKSGLTVGLSGTVGDAINGAIGETQVTRESAKDSNGRAAALHAIAAAGDLAAPVESMLAKGQVPTIGIQVSFGSSHSASQSSEDQSTQRGSKAQAGGTATFVATGDGTAGSGNLTIAGSNVGAADAVLIAKNQVNLVNTTDTYSTRSANSSSGSSIGVSITSGGIGASASMQHAHGDGNSDAAIQNNTHINATNSATLVSGGDTNMIGANVSANQVSASIGGNLNVASVQDVTTSAAHQGSVGGGIGVSTIGVSGSFSAQHGNASGNYAAVGEQAGIQAGSGGFDVTVKGNTDLKGAVIASTADASKNNLTTGTLSFSDIQDHSHYSASSGGIGAGVSVGTSEKISGKDSVSGKGGVSPMVGQSAGGDASATTRSAVGAGTITVTNAAGQAQDVAGLSRDTSNTNGAVSKTPDVQQLLSQQADTMNAAQAAGQTVATAIGDYAQSRLNEALAAKAKAQASGDAAGVAAAQAQIDEWQEGGDYRTALHAGGGALIAGLGGGNALAGAAGAGAASALSGKLNGLSNAIAASNPTGNASLDQALGNIIANVVATGAGAAVGGSAGAATASNADLFNRQLHPHEKQKLSDLEKGKSTDEQHKLVAAECALTQCAAGVPDNDPNKATLTQLQNEGQSYTYEQGLLKNAGAFDGYGRADKLNDWYDRDQMSNRLGGAVQGVESAAVAAGALGAGCASVVACGLGLTVATGALDYSKAGFTQMVSGNQTSTYGEQVLQGLGMSPYAAGLTYAGFNLGAAAGSVAANSAATQAAAQGVLPSAKEVQATNSTSLSDILLPNGEPVGYVYPGAGPGIRTVTSEQFGQLQSQLMNGATPTTTPPGYAGTWYQMPDGSVFGVRTSTGSGTTIDVIKSNNPSLPSGFKVHQQ